MKYSDLRSSLPNPPNRGSSESNTIWGTIVETYYIVLYFRYESRAVYLVFAWLGATNAVIKVAAGPVEVEDEDQITSFEHDYSISFVFS